MVCQWELTANRYAEQHLDAVVESTTKYWGLLNMVQDRPPLLLDVKNWAGWLDGVVKQSTSVGYPVLAAGAGISIAAVQSDATPPPAYAPNFRNVSALPCSHIVPGPQILNAPIAPVQYFQGHEPTVNTYSNSQSIAKYHHCFKDFKDQESSGNGFASFVDLYAVRHAEKEPFLDYVKRLEDRHRHYCEVKGDWTVTLDSDVVIHTAVSGS